MVAILAYGDVAEHTWAGFGPGNLSDGAKPLIARLRQHHRLFGSRYHQSVREFQAIAPDQGAKAVLSMMPTSQAWVSGTEKLAAETTAGAQPGHAYMSSTRSSMRVLAGM